MVFANEPARCKLLCGSVCALVPVCHWGAWHCGSARSKGRASLAHRTSRRPSPSCSTKLPPLSTTLTISREREMSRDPFITEWSAALHPAPCNPPQPLHSPPPTPNSSPPHPSPHHPSSPFPSPASPDTPPAPPTPDAPPASPTPLLALAIPCKSKSVGRCHRDLAPALSTNRHSSAAGM